LLISAYSLRKAYKKQKVLILIARRAYISQPRVVPLASGTTLGTGRHNLHPTLKGFRKPALRNPFRVGYSDCCLPTQGSGVPQPWALICNPFGIKNVPKVCTKQRTTKNESTGLRATPALASYRLIMPIKYKKLNTNFHPMWSAQVILALSLSCSR